ncbi:hypothetical protein Daesc_008196 [Daldinia eschscholtzii]|uniref:Uncharacterized protein n=1 Tax=Daldinia eschscholtzii TaxID=292717 RepID=A0AAX6MBM8_9PEZI
MAPGQNTFSIIPNAPCAINGGLDDPQSRPSKRPMTSKQAKKAYQKTNKGPKLSKAEQRRQELFEQDRIRREFEKERNQARARAAREKKKEKEEKERSEKKKKGLPLVDVRPSQATIAWFVRSDRKKKPENQTVIDSPVADHHDTDGSDGSNSATLSDEDEPEPPPKKQKTVLPDTEYSPSSAGILDCAASPVQDLEPRGTAQVVTNVAKSPVLRGSQVLEHLTSDVDDLAMMVLPDELFDDPVDAVSDLLKDDINQDVDYIPQEEQVIPNSPSPSKSLDHFISPTMAEEVLPEQEAKESTLPPADRLPLQKLDARKINSRVTNTPQELDPDQAKPVNHTPSPALDSSISVFKSTRPSISQPKSFQQPKTPMGPPPIPPRFRSRGHLSAVNPRAPHFLPKAHASSFCPAPSLNPNPNPNPNISQGHLVLQQPQEDQPPTSTQLFMLGHLDDLFPSPSQEVREIFEEPNSNIGSNGSKPEVKAGHINKSPTGRSPLSKSISAVSSHSCFGSVTRNDKTEDKPSRQCFSPIKTRGSPLLPTVNIHSSGNSESFDMPFFSTQDFFLSSQDLEDLGGEKAPQLRHEHSNERSSYISTSENLVSNKKTSSTTPSHTPIQKQPGEEKLEARISPDCDTSRPTHTRPLDEPTGFESSKLACKGTTVLNTPTESSRSHSDDFRNRTDFQRTTDGIYTATCQSTQKKPCGVLQAEKNMAPPRASPKPFFTSSRREVHRIYTTERIKTIAWENASTRQNVQKELKRFQRSENDKSNASTPVYATGNGNKNDSKPSASSSASRPPDQVKDQSRPRSINQLSGSVGSIQSQRTEVPVEPRPRQNQSRSSYEKMLELLEHAESHKQKQQTVTASQETDYGDAGLDDVLNEML